MDKRNKAALPRICCLDSPGSQLAQPATLEPAASDPAAPARLLAAALASMATAIFITDANGIILWVNDAFTRLSGYAALEAVGSTPAILNSGRHDRRYYSLLWETIQAGKVWQGQVTDRHKTGRLYVVEEIITPLFDQLGVPTHFIAIQHDITERQQESEHERYLAYHDILTGLPNRASFLLMLQLAIGRAHRDTGRLAVLFIDLDKFKPVNDAFGHHAGDQLLSAVGGRLRASIRKSDVVARIGGDEFVVVLNDKVTHGLACKLAGKLLHSLARQFTIGSHRVSIAGSIGLAFYPEDGLCVEELMIHADSAMYQAKVRGGGGYQCYTSDMAGASRPAGPS
jgi:diguanylate cyclase (GGDEF)-like protein/PAS domain S-box-containing protein